MSYEKRNDVPALAGETVVELDDGPLVAVGCDRRLLGARIVFHVRARAIDESGAPVLGSDERPVERVFKHSVEAAAADENTARQCLLAALGEETTLALSDGVLASYSIRVALQAAAGVGPVDAGEVL